MLKWDRFSRVLALLVMGILVAQGGIEAQGRTAKEHPQHPVPRHVELAADEGTVEQFANALAAAEIPVGIVIAREDNRRRTSWRPSEDSAEGQLVPFGRALELFERRHPRYALRNSNNVLRIHPTGSNRCAPAIERPVAGLSVSGTAFAVVFELVRAVNKDRGETVPPGLVGSMGSEATADRYRRQVALDLSDMSFADALDEVVKQVPGLGWAVREVQDYREPVSDEHARSTRCNVVLFSGDSWIDTSWLIEPARLSK